ncbi:MAG TPA: sensor domain-containing diguanylate cyclase [Egibacteraceae bacterium]|nr:sensor domain-containing diguanylate cyclase [Egibacteraceae bacterium]
MSGFFASALTGARSRLRAPTTLLARTQAVFLGITLLSAVPVFFAIAVRGAGEPAAEVLGYVALLGLSLWWMRNAAVRSATAVAEIGEAVGLLVVLSALSDLTAGHVLLFIALAYRSLFGGPRRATVRVALYLSALVAAHAAAGVLDEVIFLIPAVPAVATLTHTLATSIHRQERMRRREQLLISASASLSAALTVEEAGQELARTARALAGADPRGARVEVWIREGDSLTRLATSGRRRAGLWEPVAMSALADGVRERLEARGAVTRDELRAGDSDPQPGLDALAGDETGPCLLAPMVAHQRCEGVIVLASPDRSISECTPALEVLAAEASLVLERVRLTGDLRNSEKRFRSLVLHASDGITAVDADFMITYQSPSFGRLLHRDSDGLVGAPLELLIHPDDAADVLMTLGAVRHPAVGRVEARLRRSDGAYVQVEAVTNNMLADPDVGMIVLNVRDIGERKALEAQLAHQAFHDPLTNLANRALFAEHVQQALGRARRSDSKAAVLMLDLDDFKGVNDTLGHAAGDRLLTVLAERLRACVRPSDTLARLGGDEFAILVEQGAGEDHVATVADRVLAEMGAAVELEGTRVQVGASIGIAISASGRESLDELLRQADTAMYQAKASGKGRSATYEPAMRELARRSAQGAAPQRNGKK